MGDRCQLLRIVVGHQDCQLLPPVAIDHLRDVIADRRVHDGRQMGLRLVYVHKHDRNS